MATKKGARSTKKGKAKKEPRPPLDVASRKLGAKTRPFRVADARARVNSYGDNRPPMAEGRVRPGLTATVDGTKEAVIARMDERKALFLDTLRDINKSFGTIFKATEYLKGLGVIGISSRRVYQWREEDEEFDKDIRNVLADLDDQVDSEAIRRGIMGWEEPVFGSLGEGLGSGEVGTVKKFSDNLLIDIRKARRNGFGKSSGTKDPSSPTGLPVLGELTDAERVTAVNALIESVRARLARQDTDSTPKVEPDK